MLWGTIEDIHHSSSYFDNNTIASIKSNNLTAVFIPSLSSLNLIEKNMFNSNHLVKYIKSVILKEYQSAINLIQLAINKTSYLKNEDIYAEIDSDNQIEKFSKHINIKNMLNDSISKLEISNEDLNVFKIKKTYYHNEK